MQISLAKGGLSDGLRTVRHVKFCGSKSDCNAFNDMMLIGWIAAIVLLRFCDAGSACVCSITVTVAYVLFVPPYCFVAKSVL